MQNLKASWLLFFIFLQSCATSSYKVLKKDIGVRIVASPDRIVPECIWADAENPLFYAFYIHILDEENTVQNIFLSYMIDKESCENRVKKVNKILENGREIYISGVGDLNKPREMSKFSYTFPKHGTFYDNGRVVAFMVIANEKNECYYFDKHRKICPEYPFTKDSRDGNLVD